MRRTFVGFGFGPIQSGLFVYEAYRSGKFERLVVAEVAENVVEAVRRAGGRYTINSAGKTGVRVQEVQGVEIFNPQSTQDLPQLVAAISDSDEMATALPSIDFFDRGNASPALLLAHGLLQRIERKDERRTLVYAAENHNHAAEELRSRVLAHMPQGMQFWLDEHVQFTNTVIGKMSGVVDDPCEIAMAGLLPMMPGGDQAILVEQFNRIFIERLRLAELSRRIDVFEEKAQLLPFEEAKLYGHNAAHALLGFLAHRAGLALISDAKGTELLPMVHEAFSSESGVPLCERHKGIDPLFTEEGWLGYVTDLLERMTNPYLRDKVNRVIRDPIRKLGWNDRLIGTVRMGLRYGVRPTRYLTAAAAALKLVAGGTDTDRARQTLYGCWGDGAGTKHEQEEVATLVLETLSNLGNTMPMAGESRI